MVRKTFPLMLCSVFIVSIVDGPAPVAPARSEITVAASADSGTAMFASNLAAAVPETLLPIWTLRMGADVVPLRRASVVHNSFSQTSGFPFPSIVVNQAVRRPDVNMHRVFDNHTYIVGLTPSGNLAGISRPLPYGSIAGGFDVPVIVTTTGAVPEGLAVATRELDVNALALAAVPPLSAPLPPEHTLTCSPRADVCVLATREGSLFIGSTATSVRSVDGFVRWVVFSESARRLLAIQVNSQKDEDLLVVDYDGNVLLRPASIRAPAHFDEVSLQSKGTQAAVSVLSSDREERFQFDLISGDAVPLAMRVEGHQWTSSDGAYLLVARYRADQKKTSVRYFDNRTPARPQLLWELFEDQPIVDATIDEGGSYVAYQRQETWPVTALVVISLDGVHVKQTRSTGPDRNVIGVRFIGGLLVEGGLTRPLADFNSHAVHLYQYRSVRRRGPCRSGS